MRIAFCGVGGTGKSTIGKVLADSMMYQLVPSVSRPIMQEMGVTEKDFKSLSADIAWEFQQRVCMRYAEGVIKHSDGVWDRSPFDVATYTLLRCHSVMSDKDVKELLEWTFRLSNGIDHIFWCIPDVEQLKFLEDGVRDTAGGTRHVTVRVMYDLYREMYLHRRDRYNTHILPWEPLEERLLRVHRVVFGESLDETANQKPA